MEAISSGSGKSAVEVLMRSDREKVLPSKIHISSSKQPRATDRLLNDVIDYLLVLKQQGSILY